MSDDFNDEELDNQDFTTVQISSFEYDQLLQDSVWLSCLEGAGIENWDGYECAQEAFTNYIDINCRIH